MAPSHGLRMRRSLSPFRVADTMHQVDAKQAAENDDL